MEMGQSSRSLNDIQATVLIDTTGSSLFKRGYRTEKKQVPMKIWQRQFFCCQTGIQISPWLTRHVVLERFVLGGGDDCEKYRTFSLKNGTDGCLTWSPSRSKQKINREIEFDIMGNRYRCTDGWLLSKKMPRKRALAVTLLSNRCESKISLR